MVSFADVLQGYLRNRFVAFMKRKDLVLVAPSLRQVHLREGEVVVYGRPPLAQVYRKRRRLADARAKQNKTPETFAYSSGSSRKGALDLSARLAQSCCTQMFNFVTCTVSLLNQKEKKKEAPVHSE